MEPWSRAVPGMNEGSARALASAADERGAASLQRFEWPRTSCRLKCLQVAGACAAEYLVAGAGFEPATFGL